MSELINEMNIISILLNVGVLIIVSLLFFRIHKNQEENPSKWKAILVVFVGIFSLSVHQPYKETVVRLALLPVGVVILYAILVGRSRWLLYRKYAWLGFLTNYFLLISTILLVPLDQFFYPKNELASYLNQTNHTKILASHPTAAEVMLDSAVLKQQINSATKEEIFSEKWYQETFETSSKKKEERFPYLLTGSLPASGSGIKAMIYVEKDGKGLLITTGTRQTYFRTRQSILRFESGGSHD